MKLSYSIPKWAMGWAFVFLGSISYAESPKSEGREVQNCQFQLEKNTAQVEWTGFKTTEKLAVQGQFKKFEVSGPLTGSDLSTLLQGLTVVIDPSSVDTGNPARDQTIVDFFFKKFSNLKITGKVKKVSEQSHSLILTLNLNGEAYDVPLNFEWGKDQKLVASGALDLMNFGASKPLESLNQKCHDLHKGKDGVSKTWSEVGLKLSAVIQRTCQGP